MATAADRVLLRLEWKVLRRLDGRMQGTYRTPRRGVGLDFIGTRPYVDGDDARYIDWNATARTDELQVREFNEDRELTAWLVLDRSASMAVGALGRGKGDVLVEVSLALARLFGRGGNRVGAVLYDTGSVRIVRPGSGRRQALRISRELERTAAAQHGATTDLAAMIAAVSNLAKRSLVVIISDFVGAGDWTDPLLQLSFRNEVVALRVVDPADDALPEVGLLVVEDAETGEQLLVDSSDPLFRERFSAGISELDTAIADGMVRAQVPMHRVDTTSDLVTTLIGVVAETQRRRA
jgi:uncharacterized protein (DUF58 family)